MERLVYMCLQIYSFDQATLGYFGVLASCINFEIKLICETRDTSIVDYLQSRPSSTIVPCSTISLSTIVCHSTFLKKINIEVCLQFAISNPFSYTPKHWNTEPKLMCMAKCSAMWLSWLMVQAWV